MSTRIYNGFEFPTSDFMEADRLVRAFRPVIHQLQIRHYAQYMARRAIRILDATLLEMPDKSREEVSANQAENPTPARKYRGNSPFGAARRELMDETMNASRSSQKNPLLDTYFEIWMIACEGRLLGIVNSAHDAWTRQWNKAAGTQPMSYWDNSDRPSGMSDKAWRERGRLWEQALGANGVPADSCWTSQLSSEYLVMSLDVQSVAGSLVSRMAQKTYSARLTDAATTLLMQADGAERFSDTTEFLEFANDTRKRVQGLADDDAVQALRKAEGFLPQRVTVELLKTSFDTLRQQQAEKTDAPQGPALSL